MFFGTQCILCITIWCTTVQSYDTTCYIAAALCCIETVKSVVPAGSRGQRAFKTPKRLVYDDDAKAVHGVRAVCVPDAPSSRCTGRVPPSTASVGQSTALTKNSCRIHASSSQRTARHSSTLTTSRRCHGAQSATLDLGKTGLSDKRAVKSALKDRTSSVQTNSERQSRCNGRIETSTTQRQTSAADHKPPANVKLKQTKIKRTKPDGLVIIITCHAFRFINQQEVIQISKNEYSAIRRKKTRCAYA